MYMCIRFGVDILTRASIKSSKYSKWLIACLTSGNASDEKVRQDLKISSFRWTFYTRVEMKLAHFHDDSETIPEMANKNLV